MEGGESKFRVARQCSAVAREDSTGDKVGEEEMSCPVLLPAWADLSISETTPDWFSVSLMTGKNGKNSEFSLLKHEKV